MRDEAPKVVIDIIPNFPLLVYVTFKVKLADVTEELKNKTTAFSRCGSSNNKPYCDVSQKGIALEAPLGLCVKHF